MNYTENTLFQQTTPDYLQQQLSRKSVYAHNNEDFESSSRRGRSAEGGRDE